ncbi:MAG: DUF4835 family protein [Flavobacterium sp.]
MKKIYLLIYLITNVIIGQEINCDVQINSERATTTNTKILQSLKNSITDFVNKTQWTEKKFNNQEKIQCSFFINISEVNGNLFNASIQVNATRPIFNTNYSSPILNFIDKEFTFEYIEFQNMFFNPNSFDSNLTAVLAYYTYMILGIDADSFGLNGGTAYYEKALGIVNLAQNTGFAGWDAGKNLINRYYMVNDILNNMYDPMRKTIYNYHSSGLDIMSDDANGGKIEIKNAIENLEILHKTRPNSLWMRIFVDAKSDELVQIFSGGPKLDINKMVNSLSNFSPSNTNSWNKLKF